MDKKRYTVKEAAVELDLSDGRVRQMVIAGEIEYEKFGRMLVITEKGIEQARNRNKKPGPTSPRRKAA